MNTHNPIMAALLAEENVSEEFRAAVAQHGNTQMGNSGYRRWTLSAPAWSGAQFGEELITVHRLDDGTVSGCTESNQRVCRELSDEELASVIREFQLEVTP